MAIRNTTPELYNETIAYLRRLTKLKPWVGIVLGSGLGGLTEVIESEIEINYSEIPNFPISTVEGHAGKLIFGHIGSTPIVAMKGRFHYYEGYEMLEVTYPIRIMSLLGIKYLFVSNASGGLNPDFSTGDLMIITDHINFFKDNPLRGQNDEKFGLRFPDMSCVYDRDLIALAHKIGKQKGIDLKEGVYIGSSGPTLETPAEYRMFRILGADATGMSTVPEIIVARHAGIKCFGISIITNESKKQSADSPTTHQEVNTNAAAAEPKLTSIFAEMISNIHE